MRNRRSRVDLAQAAAATFTLGNDHGPRSRGALAPLHVVEMAAMSQACVCGLNPETNVAGDRWVRRDSGQPCVPGWG